MQTETKEDCRALKTKSRQYQIELPNISDIDNYVLRNGMKKSEVVNMALRKFFKSVPTNCLFLVTVIVTIEAARAWGVDGLADISMDTMAERAGELIRKIAGISALIGGSIGFISAGVLYQRGDNRASTVLTGTAIGTTICLLAWAFAKQIIGIFA